ncbi:hypothetical protein [Dactylosporangium sp. NPDC051484]|uniref:hypothetical protein n=1 Tax=Dactylosporangium sp. NPDC051484 TaxID=3154942 RepID=UPI00344F5824
MLVRRLVLATVPAVAAVLLFAGTAAAAVKVPLKSSHRNTTAAAFKKDCDHIPNKDRGAGKDGFVFVLPGNDADFVTLDLKFRDTGGNTVPITISNTPGAYPYGIITDKGSSKAYIVVPYGWRLLDGEAWVDNNNTKAKDFNVSHTCQGGPAASPSPSKSPSASPSASISPSTSASASTSPSTSESPSESPSASLSPSVSATPEASTDPSQTPVPSVSPSTPGGGLPVTGVAVGGTALAGAALVAGGIALLAIRRRRAQLAFVADPDANPSGNGK